MSKANILLQSIKNSNNEAELSKNINGIKSVMSEVEFSTFSNSLKSAKDFKEKLLVFMGAAEWFVEQEMKNKEEEEEKTVVKIAAKTKAKMVSIEDKEKGSLELMVIGRKTANTKEFDVKEVKEQLKNALNTINKDNLKKEIKEAMTELNPFYVILSLLKDSELDEIFSMCTIRLILKPEQKEVVDKALLKINVLKNRSDVLSRTIVSLIGFFGAGLIKQEKEVGNLFRFIKNPLLKEEPTDRPLRILKNETKEERRERTESHIEAFKNYVELMKSFQDYSKDFENVPNEVKLRVKDQILTWFV